MIGVFISCTLFIYINTCIIPTRQKIHLILTEYYLEHNVLCDSLGHGSNPDRMSESPSR